MTDIEAIELIKKYVATNEKKSRELEEECSKDQYIKRIVHEAHENAYNSVLNYLNALERTLKKENK